MSNAVSGEFLSQVGRDLVRRGQSMHRIHVRPVRAWSVLIPASSWHFEGGDDPDTWTLSKGYDLWT